MNVKISTMLIPTKNAVKSRCRIYVRIIRNTENEYLLTEFVVCIRKMVKVDVKENI